MKPDLQQLEKALGHEFRDLRHLEKALTHPSFSNENGENSDNQRLEFLGDAVLGMISAGYLLHRFRHLQEGDLTRLRSALTNSRMLARIARHIGLGAYLRLGCGEHRSGGSKRPSILADAVEALIGAAYEDGGLCAARCIFERLFLPRLDGLLEDTVSHNPKGAFQEYAQRKWHTQPVYEISENGGPCHAPIFHAKALILGVVYGRGSGPNKRAAEKAAARQAMAAILAETKTGAGNRTSPSSCSALSRGF